MTNMWEGLGPDHTPTAPYPAAGSPGAARGGGSGGGPAGAPSGGGRRRRWTAGLLIAAVAAGGGAFAVAEATGSPTAAATTPVSLSAAPAAQDAAVQSVLSAAVSGHRRLGRLARLRGIGGMYGQFTYETKKGAVTVAFERGTITSVATDDVVVRAQDGTTQVWDLSSASVVRDHGKRSTASSLATGELVFAGGPVTNGTRNAALIVVRKAASGSA